MIFYYCVQTMKQLLLRSKVITIASIDIQTMKVERVLINWSKMSSLLRLKNLKYFQTINKYKYSCGSVLSIKCGKINNTASDFTRVLLPITFSLNQPCSQIWLLSQIVSCFCSK
ncbi:Hypothetical_protein [Hexamita inflata]|uniref:Hypothetical_protein n=1 Tax=Hexamita inflata TaxID=28002 RepID=A0AA86PXE4_9EUKA|nr:Hypothetical protein HINF_LOCUS33567 [Hexamita inflata]